MSTAGGNPPNKQQSYATATDEQLAHAMVGEKGEDDAAWREFMARYGERMMRVIRHVGPSLSQDDREEVFARAMDRIHDAIDRFRPRGSTSLGSWAYKVAQNVTYDWFRDESKGDFVSLAEVGETLSVDPYETTDPMPHRDAAMAALERAKAKLPPRHQTILALTEAGLSDREIAERLGMRVDTVRKVRYKVLARLKALLIKERDGMGWV
jgi:RNA polymerase sigma factor (sigma-70 family)